MTKSVGPLYSDPGCGTLMLPTFERLKLRLYSLRLHTFMPARRNKPKRFNAYQRLKAVHSTFSGIYTWTTDGSFAPRYQYDMNPAQCKIST